MGCSPEPYLSCTLCRFGRILEDLDSLAGTIQHHELVHIRICCRLHLSLRIHSYVTQWQLQTKFIWYYICLQRYKTFWFPSKTHPFVLSLNVCLVLICYSHTWNKELNRSPLSIVTALVDKIGMLINTRYYENKHTNNKVIFCLLTERASVRSLNVLNFNLMSIAYWRLANCPSDMRKNIIYPDCDIKFTGNVTWVGKTSIEAKMHMSQVYDRLLLPLSHVQYDNITQCNTTQY